jgi:hypothetical protein
MPLGHRTGADEHIAANENSIRILWFGHGCVSSRYGLDIVEICVGNKYVGTQQRAVTD